MFFAGSADKEMPKLYLPSEWTPDRDSIPIEFRARVNQFTNALQEAFHRRKVLSNLTVFQQCTLKKLRESEDFIVFPSDKNLGPVILERTSYIKRVLDDHLLNGDTYCQLTPEAATAGVDRSKQLVQAFLSTYKRKDKNAGSGLSSADETFLERSLDVKDKFSYFYITAKIHKTPWKTRPIVSVPGSILHGLGRWIDSQLQVICRDLPSYLRSSFDLKQDLERLVSNDDDLDLTRVRIFTADAVSMYTNIDTDHALQTIGTYLRQKKHLLPPCILVEALLSALDIVMRNNIFRFGDTFWKQLTGTAMGTPPATMYATLYYAIHEMNSLCPRFESSLCLYKRYIDDIFGLWLIDEDPVKDEQNWLEFQRSLAYGKLTWEVTNRETSVNFMDLTISIDASKKSPINSRIYEKPLNLYLYLPPHSAHPPGVLRGLITGMTNRIYRLTTTKSDQLNSLRSLHRRLLLRGYSHTMIGPMLTEAVKHVEDRLRTAPAEGTHNPRLFLHMPFHPRDPASNVLQRTFRDNLLQPERETELPSLRNRDGAYFCIDRMTVAYHRPLNLKNLLFPRKFREPTDAPVSQHIIDNPDIHYPTTAFATQS